MTSHISLEIKAIDHVGIRVSDLTSALKFYRLLGFQEDPEEYYPEYRSTGLKNQHGIHINLIDNAKASASNQFNILVDAEIKRPGLTHLALVVRNLQEAIRFFQAQKISITEGPLILKRRIAIFVRDPDGNVIEINQLLYTLHV